MPPEFSPGFGFDRPVVTVITPTFRRPERALIAARSILAQVTDAAFELVLVDNDPAGSALVQLRKLAAEASVPVRVIHEPNAGVANARNAGLAVARGKFIAFLDDDEIAPLHWLQEMLKVQRELDADILFGPVHTRLEAIPGEHRDYYDAFFARDPGHGQRLIEDVYGCGCSMIRRGALPSSQPFAAERNEIGGEDDLLFHGMAARGARIGWAPDAYVFETPEPSRVTLAYTLRRAFAYGQGPATAASRRTPSDISAIAFWMAAGLAQAAVFLPAALLALAIRHPKRAFAYRKLVEGLGKTLWFPIMKPRFYGAARLKQLGVASASASTAG